MLKTPPSFLVEFSSEEPGVAAYPLAHLPPVQSGEKTLELVCTSGAQLNPSLFVPLIPESLFSRVAIDGSLCERLYACREHTLHADQAKVLGRPNGQKTVLVMIKTLV